MEEAKKVLLWVSSKNRVPLHASFQLVLQRNHDNEPDTLTHPTQDSLLHNRHEDNNNSNNSNSSNDDPSAIRRERGRRIISIQSIVEPLLNLRVLLSKDYRYTTLLLWIYWFCIAYGSYGTIVFFPIYFEMKGLTFDSVYLGVFLGALGNLGSFFIVYFLVNRMGRYIPFLLFFVIIQSYVDVFNNNLYSSLINVCMYVCLGNTCWESIWYWEQYPSSSLHWPIRCPLFSLRVLSSIYSLNRGGLYSMYILQRSIPPVFVPRVTMIHITYLSRSFCLIDQFYIFHLSICLEIPT